MFLLKNSFFFARNGNVHENILLRKEKHPFLPVKIDINAP